MRRFWAGRQGSLTDETGREQPPSPSSPPKANIQTLSPYAIVPIAFRSRNMIGSRTAVVGTTIGGAGEQPMARNDDDLSALDVLIVTALIGLTLGVGWKLWGSLFSS